MGSKICPRTSSPQRESRSEGFTFGSADKISAQSGLEGPENSSLTPGGQRARPVFAGLRAIWGQGKTLWMLWIQDPSRLWKTLRNRGAQQAPCRERYRPRCGDNARAAEPEDARPEARKARRA